MGFESFNVIKTLGEGAFASVLKVTRLADGKTYALKKVDVGSLDDKELVSALNEIRLLASFAHPRIVRLYETFVEANNLCIVMEYCGWGDLAMKVKRYIKRREYIDERVIWVYLIQILEGLKALHERNVLHRDLKPANCFLSEDGSIKIGDMNVSKVIKDGNARTQIGTPYYMSPEIWGRRPYNYATDIWSLGCLIYELCALRPPFLGNNMTELKQAVLSGHYPPIPSVYSTELAVVISRMLQPTPKDRPTAAQALAYPEVVTRKCLVKNVLHEEDIPRPAPDDDALMPTINVSNLRELAAKLPGPCYPDDAPPTPTSPAESHADPVEQSEDADARRPSAVPTEEPAHGPVGRRSSVEARHARRGSVVPITVERSALQHQRRKSVDVPQLPQGSLPKLGPGPEEGEGASGAGSPTGAPRPSVSSPGGQRGVDGVNLERQGSIRAVLQAAQSEAHPQAASPSSEARRDSHARRRSAGGV